MALTPAQKHLIRGLKMFGVGEDETVGIILMLDTPEKRDKLMVWMAQNLEATPLEIMKKTLDILRMEEHEKL